MAFKWNGKSSDGKTVTLQHLSLYPLRFPAYYNSAWAEKNKDKIRRAAFVDTETTGTDHEIHEIIEIAVKSVKFNRETGEILEVLRSYEGFQEPGTPLAPEITTITGLTDKDLSGKNISWAEVDSIFDEVDLVVAHNAKFDRGFIDKKSKISKDLIWGCSIVYVDWFSKGFLSSGLEMLCIKHGFFNDAHRAMNDVNSMIYLLTLGVDGAPYFKELIESARKPKYRIYAFGAAFEVKSVLKGNNYEWNQDLKVWHKTVNSDDSKLEFEWLTEHAYAGSTSHRGEVRKIELCDIFKSFVA